ncbi:alpha/beta hydrolase family esterase [Actinoplanes sp. CA-015351]|uniref:alpha/beta hydrolase family esterase n=1 Tax=Actinoplanes sp. CA-015351 TaxID=3239897 RepID=UPI003D95DBF5
MRGPTLLCVAVVLLAAGCSDPAASPSPSTGVAPGLSENSLVVDGLTRDYLLYRAAAVTGPAPLVLVLHGSSESAAMSEQQRGWDQAADRHGFVVAYLDGISHSFNAGSCCGPAAARHIDDVSASLAVIDTISEGTPIDTTRVYAAGFSNGAGLAYRLACETDRFAAIGPVSGSEMTPCVTRRPTSILHIHGNADIVIQPRGGKLPNGSVTPPVGEVLSAWRTAMSCDAATETTKGRVHSSAAACPDGRDVNLLLVEGLPHTWSTDSTVLDTTETLAQFFDAHAH